MPQGVTSGYPKHRLALLTFPPIGILDKDESYGRKPRNSTRPSGLDHRDSAGRGDSRCGAGPDSFVAEPDSPLGFRLGRRWAGDVRPADLHPADRCCSFLSMTVKALRRRLPG